MVELHDDAMKGGNRAAKANGGARSRSLSFMGARRGRAEPAKPRR